MRAYPEYKDSGVEWLGEIPNHWNVKPLKHIVTIGPSVPDELDKNLSQMVSFIPMEYLGTNGTLNLSTNKDVKSVRQGYNYFANGDVVLAKVTPCFENGKAAIARELTGGHAFGSTELYVLRPEKIETNYLFYLMTSENFRGPGSSRMLGTGGLKRVSIDFIEYFKCPFPSMDEQREIASYLDRETARIDKLISEKQNFIKLLKEKRQALINHVVTKGLDPHVKMKDSGIEWIGEVPEHWDVSRVKFVTSGIVDGPHFSPTYVDDGIPFISARNIKVNEWSLSNAKYISEEDYREFCKRVTPEFGDVLLTKGGTTGIARAVDLKFPFQVWVHVAVLKTLKKKINPDYLAYSLNSKQCYEQSQLYTRGASNKDLGLLRIANILFALPSLNEQLKIVEYVNSSTKSIDSTINETKSSIELLKEHRTALISAAVTGKIDVRDHAK